MESSEIAFSNPKSNILIKAIGHNLVVLIVGAIFGFIGFGLDWLLKLGNYRSIITIIVGAILVLIGFLIRLRATYYFYEKSMSVIKMEPQNALITTGPFGFSRNPLYLGGNGFVFFGAILVFGSYAGILVFIIQLIAVNHMIQREEKQLETTFGEAYLQYKQRVRRWF